MFVGSKIQDWSWRLVIDHKGYAVIGRKAAEKGLGDEEVRVLEKIDGGTGLEKKENLGWRINGSEVGDWLNLVVIEDLEIGGLETFDEIAFGIGDDDADIHAIDVDANGVIDRGGGLLSGERNTRYSQGDENCGAEAERAPEFPRANVSPANPQSELRGRPSRTLRPWYASIWRKRRD